MDGYRRWNIGLADGVTQRLTRILGYRRAIELIVTGRVIDAREAERIGLVNQVVPSGTCVQRAIELAESIAALPQPALRTDLEAARRGQGRPLDEGLHIEAECFGRSIVESETAEGLRRFNERDHPDRWPEAAPVTPASYAANQDHRRSDAFISTVVRTIVKSAYVGMRPC